MDNEPLRARPDLLELCRALWGPALLMVYGEGEQCEMKEWGVYLALPDGGEMEFEFSTGHRVRVSISEWGQIYIPHAQQRT